MNKLQAMTLFTLLWAVIVFEVGTLIPDPSAHFTEILLGGFVVVVVGGIIFGRGNNDKES